MRTAILLNSSLSAWIMAVIYYQVEVKTGIELKLLLCAAILILVVGLFFGCRDNKETTKEEG